ncbi:hypothetical protein I551_9192 [Mycobacterium ulcerans str. Harvey]|uniref:Uncharacterized protein n=1 Tax=Mycobacterium ulcerans str. Harvey TaxID=1299332 RepID=A0ABN0R9G6_MYCUL|nr:hypothetical protein I551_9192 [Mycobacterium ulcerans str. Harvey]
MPSHVDQLVAQLGVPDQRRKSSMATVMPTWFTGLLVKVWMARSGRERRGTARGRQCGSH